MKEPIAPIIHRLMRELEDGSFKIEGYQKLEGGKIYHQFEGLDSWDRIYDLTSKYDSFQTFYIQHDRIDRFTGTTLNDKTKVFERDHAMDSAGRVRTVVWSEEHNGWSLEYKSVCVLRLCKDFIDKIVGIDGVHKTEERGKA